MLDVGLGSLRSEEDPTSTNIHVKIPIHIIKRSTMLSMHISHVVTLVACSLALCSLTRNVLRVDDRSWMLGWYLNGNYNGIHSNA